MKFFRSGSYATVASTAALVVALGGTSYAAAKITSSDIKDGTIQTRDIKDGTIQTRDIKDGTIQTKDLNATARTTAASVHNENGTVMASTDKAVLSLNLKKGDYFVTSKGYAYGSANYAYARCNLIAPNGTTADTSWWWSGYNETGYSTLVNEAVLHVGTTGTVQLRCYGANATLYGKKLTAIRVASFSNVTGADVAKVAQPKAKGPAKQG